ncbi:MAG TPA: DUF885 domain-containing protein [Chitinophagaceae bacterium]|nr:DUF885 domain-containing protein [Chitinophagaceae bacterium]
MKLFPLEATTNGDNRYNDQYPNFASVSYREQIKSLYQNYLDSVNQYKREELNDNDRISYDIFKREMEIQLENFKFKNDLLMPINQFYSPTLDFGQLGSGEGNQPFKTVEDYRNWLLRVNGFAIWVDSAIANMRTGIKEGYVWPKSLVVKMIPQAKELAKKDVKQNLFYGPINKLPKEFSDEDKKRITSEYENAISEKIVPSYQKLADFFEKEYLPASRKSSGFDSLPDGKERYAYLVRFWTTTDKTPDEIYETGLKEVARIRSEMERIKDEVGFKGDLKAFFEFMKNDKQFMPYKKPEEVIEAFKQIQNRIDPKLKTMFSNVPKTRFEIRQTEAFRAASSSAEYQQGTADGTRPGIFYIPILDAAKFNTTSGMESLFLHEAIPGHHYQISLQQENESLPKFRRFSCYGAYGEGWALYAESLGKELGLYTDPYQYMGALGDEIHRAIRLVVDVAIHTKGWSREKAIEYMLENEAISEEGATAEIERYMAIAGQALSYKVGALKIRDLREKYKKELGNSFNIASFHDEVLKDGCMPLLVLEQKMDIWAAKQTK